MILNYFIWASGCLWVISVTMYLWFLCADLEFRSTWPVGLAIVSFFGLAWVLLKLVRLWKSSQGGNIE